MSGFLKSIFGGKDESNEAEAQPVYATETAGEQSHVSPVRVSLDASERDEGGEGAHDTGSLGEVSQDEGSDDDAIDTGGAQSMKFDDKSKQQASGSWSGPREFDLDAVWESRNVTAQEQKRVAKTQELLSALPAGIPADAKRQIVEASLKAFEVSIGDIIDGASHEIEALEVFISTTNTEADDFDARSRKRIEELESEISQIRETMKAADADRDSLVKSADQVINKVTPILDFFEPSTTQAAKPGSATGASAASGNTTLGKADIKQDSADGNEAAGEISKGSTAQALKQSSSDLPSTPGG